MLIGALLFALVLARLDDDTARLRTLVARTGHQWPGWAAAGPQPSPPRGSSPTGC